MKLTKATLKRIIKEELEATIHEQEESEEGERSKFARRTPAVEKFNNSHFGNPELTGFAGLEDALGKMGAQLLLIKRVAHECEVIAQGGDENNRYGASDPENFKVFKEMGALCDEISSKLRTNVFLGYEER
jgi:hypothetical protein